VNSRTLHLTIASLALVGLALAAGFASANGSTHRSNAERQRSSARPNIIFVLTDDLAWNLVQYMPHVQQMQRQGTTFSNYFVTDSLCCPSRSSIFTGKYPHDTGVFTNGGNDGGFHVFHARGEEQQTFATRLQQSGYLTGMMGKYLNGYTPAGLVDGKPAYIPPGWNEWDVAGNGYPEFNYTLNQNGTLVHHGSQPQDYLTDVMARKGVAFIDRATAAKKPFLLEIATFAPHAPYTPAPRDADDFPGLQAPRTPAFNEADISDKPAWLRSHNSLTATQIANIDAAYRKRAQAVEAVDDMIVKLRARLAHDGVAGNTYIFFSSDNGYHMGDHRLMPGKQTAFETDIRVPLIVAGPGVARGHEVKRIGENIDLYPTFVKLGRTSVPPSVDGRSLVPLFGKRDVPVWRDAALVEHHGPDFDRTDPDAPAPGSGNPTTYEALRLPESTYVEYADGEREYYDLRDDPFELTNTVSGLSSSRLASLHSTLAGLENCHSSASCFHVVEGRR
jgi:N-acetylglucosamine-6-sulfatase